jgi:hypothetical protein
MCSGEGPDPPVGSGEATVRGERPAVDEKLLLLWGDVGSGKSCLLATGLLGPRSRDRLEGLIDWSASSQEIHRGLQEHYRRLFNGLPTVTTDGQPQPIRLRLRSGKGVLLQDIRGEWTRAPEEETTHRLLSKADAVLFVAAWRARESRRQFEAIRAALRALDRRPCGVAFTKCEEGLAYGHPDWAEAERLAAGQPPSGWWRRAAVWAPDEAHTLERVGQVWPTSAYGFHQGRPACLLDEFGEMIPYSISPLNTTEVLEWFLRQLDV